MKKFISILLSLITIFSSLSSNNITVFAENNLNISSNYAILMEYETGDILFERNAHERIAPASTTKTWTAYVVLKYVDDLSEVIEIKDFEPVEGSSMYLKNGERFTVKQLLDALLVQSANDVSVVLAEFVSGSVEEFCKLMTEEAKLIGAVNTNFSNPHGLDDINHYTTPYDMVLMSREAMNIDIFREIVQTTEITYESNEYSEIARAFSNTNQFLHESSPYYYEAVDGIKTGTTDDAGRCLVSSAVKDNRRLIAGVFKANDDSLYSDSRSLLDYGFENFTSHTILNKDKYLKSESIFLSKEGALTYSPKSSYKVVLPNDKDPDEYTFNEELTDTDMPIEIGDTVGYLEIYDNETLVTKVSLIAENNVTSVLGFLGFLGNMNFFKTVILLIVFTLFLIVFVGFLIRSYIIYNQKQRRRYKKNIFSSSNNRNRSRTYRQKRRR